MNKSKCPKGNNSLIIRSLDIIISILGLIIITPVIIIVLLLVLIIDRHPPLFIQERLGRNKKPFLIFKIRTMKPSTPDSPAHLVDKSSITQLGKLLRKYKIDELPQLINVLKGEMSIVGPRPSISNEKRIIKEREKRGLYLFKPGITGLATINNIDMSKPKIVARLDSITMKNLNVCIYLFIIVQTIAGKGFGDPASR